MDKKIENEGFENFQRNAPAYEFDAESETLFNLAMSQGRLAVCLTDPAQEDNPIVFANDAFVALTGYSESEILGRNCRFLQGAKSETMAVEKIRDAIKNRSNTVVELLNYRKDGSSFVNALHLGPIFDKDGTLRFFFGSQWDITEKTAFNEMRRKQALAFANIGVWEYYPESQKSKIDEQVNNLFDLETTSGEEVDLEVIMNRIHPDDAKRVSKSMSQALSDSNYEFKEKFRVIETSGNVRWLLGIARSSDGFEGKGEKHLIGVNYDITTEKNHEEGLVKAKEQIELTARELNHRIGNLFAVISALVSMGGRETESAQEAAKITRERIMSLAKAHELTNGLGLHVETSLHKFFEVIFETYLADDRIKFSGDSVALDSTYMSALGLIFHELSTNAVKYGGLSSEHSNVSVSWSVEPDDRLKIIWKEQSEKGSNPPEKNGFGSRLIDTMTKKLSGEMTYDWSKTGLVATLTFPLSKADNR
jgi:PAS domain S-box-containing protein